MFGAKTSFFSGPYFSQTGNKPAEHVCVSKIYFLNIFLAKIAIHFVSNLF